MLVAYLHGNAGTVTRTDSHFDKLDIRNNYSATFNYIRKIDTLGSTLKLLADYTLSLIHISSVRLSIFEIFARTFTVPPRRPSL